MVTEIKFGDRCNPLDREAKTTVPSRKRTLGNETQKRHLGTKSKTQLGSAAAEAGPGGETGWG